MVEEKKVALTELDNDIMKSLLESYDKDLVEHLNFTDMEKKKIVDYATKIKYGGFLWIPLSCMGASDCVYNKICPIATKAPIGRVCPFEQLAASQWFNDYVRSLDIDVDDKVERSQIMELVESDIINSRANAMLSAQGLIMENPVGVDPDSGNVVYRKEEHLAMSVKQKAQLRRDRLLKAFIATRESKMKAINGKIEDPTTYFAKLREAALKAGAIHQVEAIIAEKAPLPNEVVADQKGNKTVW